MFCRFLLWRHAQGMTILVVMIYINTHFCLERQYYSNYKWYSRIRRGKSKPNLCNHTWLPHTTVYGLRISKNIRMAFKYCMVPIFKKDKYICQICDCGWGDQRIFLGFTQTNSRSLAFSTQKWHSISLFTLPKALQSTYMVLVLFGIGQHCRPC